MSRDDVEELYLRYRIPESVERQWMSELTAEKLAALSSAGNWASVNFLVSHGLGGQLDELLSVKPMGRLWERTAFLEHLLRYIEATPLDPAGRTRAIKYVLAETDVLLRACRSDRTAERVREVVRAAEGIRDRHS